MPSGSGLLAPNLSYPAPRPLFNPFNVQPPDGKLKIVMVCFAMTFCDSCDDFILRIDLSNQIILLMRDTTKNIIKIKVLFNR